MNEIVKILMERDGMTKAEAVAQFKETRKTLLDAAASGDYDEAEEIMYSDLGLEMDYIFDLL